MAGVGRILLAYQRACHLNLNSRVKIRFGLFDVNFCVKMRFGMSDVVSDRSVEAFAVQVDDFVRYVQIKRSLRMVWRAAMNAIAA